MNSCDKMHPLLDALFEGVELKAGDRETLFAHLRSCDACRGVYDQRAALEEAVHGAVTEEGDPETDGVAGSAAALPAHMAWLQERAIEYALEEPSPEQSATRADQAAEQRPPLAIWQRLLGPRGWGAVGAAAAAAAAALFWISTPDPLTDEPNEDPHGLVARAGTQPPVSLRLFCGVPAADDQVRFVPIVTPPGPGQVDGCNTAQDSLHVALRSQTPGVCYILERTGDAALRMLAGPLAVSGADKEQALPKTVPLTGRPEGLMNLILVVAPEAVPEQQLFGTLQGDLPEGWQVLERGVALHSNPGGTTP